MVIESRTGLLLWLLTTGCLALAFSALIVGDLIGDDGGWVEIVFVVGWAISTLAFVAFLALVLRARRSGRTTV